MCLFLKKNMTANGSSLVFNSVYTVSVRVNFENLFKKKDTRQAGKEGFGASSTETWAWENVPYM